MQVATLFQEESQSLLGSSAGMEAVTAAPTAAAAATATITSTGSSPSVASPSGPGSAIAIASTTPTEASTPLISATATPPPPSSTSSSPPLPTVSASSPTASTSSSSSSSSASSSSSSSASSASCCTPPNSNCSSGGSGPATTISTPSSASGGPPPPSATPPPTTSTLVVASEQQQSQPQVEQMQQQSPLSPPPQEPQQLMTPTGACHPHGACHDVCHDACHDSSAVPLNLCPSALSVNVGYDFSTNNPNHPANYSNKYKMNMKLEREDDGYETANSLPPRSATTDAGGNSGGEIKCEKLEDPYSFIDDDPMPIMNSNGSGVMQPHPIHMQQQQHHQQQQQHPMHGQQQHQMSGIGEGGAMGSDGSGMLASGAPPPYGIDSGLSYHYHMAAGPKKRGRKKKIKSDEPEFTTDPNGATIPRPPKERKKHDRFNGMPEEEVSKRTLPDHITSNLDIIIIGINPGLFAAYKGHHYAGPGNHFWKCLYLSGLTPQQMSADEDYKLLQVGIGFTNMVARATKGSADLTRKEIKDGSQILLEKIKKFQPKIAVFNGKLIYEVFSGKKDFNFGRQPDLVEGTSTYMWVMPSSSARCAQLPRAADKVPFYAALKKFRDYLNGIVASIDDAELVFTEPRVKSCYEAEPRGDPLLFAADALTDVGDDNTVINRDEDGSVVNPASSVAGAAAAAANMQGLLPNKKKRGRPKKVKVEGGGEEGGAAPVVKPPSQPRRNNNSTNNANNCDFPKKKRGRPKKVKVALTDEEADMSNMNASLLRGSAGLNSDLSSSNSMHLGMGGSHHGLSGLHPMLHAGPLALDNGTNNNHLSAKCFSSPSPIQSPPPHHFYHHQQQQQQQHHHHPHHPLQQQQQQQQLYGGYCLSPRPSHPHTPVQLYGSAVHTTPNHNSSNSSQSPRPQSQPFTHSDLSSEISAAISSSEQLGSPPPSPGMLGAPDFEPPTSMAEEDGGGSSSVHGDSGGGPSTGNGPGSSGGGECCRLSPATTPNTVAVEQQHYSGYHSAYSHHHHQQHQQQQQQQFHVGSGPMDHPGPPSSVGIAAVPPPPAPTTPDLHQQQQQQSPQPQVAHQHTQQDIAAKSLSGLESLVDQIPSITDGEAAVLSEPTDYSTHQFSHSHGHQYGGGAMSRTATGSPVGDIGAAALYGYGSGSISSGAQVSSYHHPVPHALYPTPSWATTSYDSPHVPLPYQPSVYGHGPPPVAVPPPVHHHQGAYGAPGAAPIHVPSPNYPSPYYGYPPQTHHHHGYHHHHHHPSYLGGF